MTFFSISGEATYRTAEAVLKDGELSIWLRMAYANLAFSLQDARKLHSDLGEAIRAAESVLAPPAMAAE